MLRKSWLALALLLVSRCLIADEWQPSRTHAVIVGVLEWQAKLTPYSKRHRKDLELREVLLERGVPEENIQVLLDEEATLAHIRATIDRAARAAEPEDTLIVYYAGHGWRDGDDFCFANYDVDLKRAGTAWSLRQLGETLAEEFEGEQAFFWADCCYSGGLASVVEKLSEADISAFSLTSAGTDNSSTNNWTFTQSMIDGLRGNPLMDLNADGEVTLGELRADVRDAMRNLEGQASGFKSAGIEDDFVLATTSGSRPTSENGEFPVGVYVQADQRYGRVVGGEGDEVDVQFYNYSDKVVEEIEADKLALSTRKVKADTVLDAGIKADCQVEWQDRWWPAKIIEKKGSRWRIHYLGYDDQWDEWVGEARIRLESKEGADSDAE